MRSATWQRDLFEIKLGKKDMTCWRDVPEVQALGQVYDTAIAYIKKEFLAKNKDPLARQVPTRTQHPSCAPGVAHTACVH
jgi:hypothetical protein